MNILNTIESFINRYQTFIHAKRQVHYWNNVFKQNIKSLGGGNLTNTQESQIKTLYSKYCRISTVYHRFYTLATGKFDARYIPDDLYYAYIDPFYNDWGRAVHIDHKGYYRLMFPGAKQPTLLVYRMNGYWYDKDGNLIDCNEAIRICRSVKTCFVKQATESEGGHGITFMDNSQDDEARIVEVFENTKFDLVVQAGLEQSNILSAIYESSVNTIRLYTLFKRDGSVKLYSVILRMGINGAKVDNASSGGITVGVEGDGRLKRYAYNAKGVRFDKHPTSGVCFNDYIIPNFEKVKTLVLNQALNFPHFRIISWDVAIDKDNEPVIIEANLRFGEIDFHQLNNGPLFGDDTEEILKEVFGSHK